MHHLATVALVVRRALAASAAVVVLALSGVAFHPAAAISFTHLDQVETVGTTDEALLAGSWYCGDLESWAQNFNYVWVGNYPSFEEFQAEFGELHTADRGDGVYCAAGLIAPDAYREVNATSAFQALGLLTLFILVAVIGVKAVKYIISAVV